ncbi:MAG: nucleoside-diphosphate kinase [Candidatus Thermoplasmatota archaeon]|nr:nucleoside-diphosphate kinase [Candidatus Thermoplasmatota archaeon]
MGSRTFVLIKPDGVQRGLVGAIIRRFEERGLKLVGIQMRHVSEELAESYYAEHRGKDFFLPLVAYVTSGPVVAMVWEGPQAVEVARGTIGATDPADATPGTIRGDYGVDISRNLVHGADSEASARREIGLFFRDEEILSYTRIDEFWLRGS